MLVRLIFLFSFSPLDHLPAFYDLFRDEVLAPLQMILNNILRLLHEKNCVKEIFYIHIARSILISW